MHVQVMLNNVQLSRFIGLVAAVTTFGAVAVIVYTAWVPEDPAVWSVAKVIASAYTAGQGWLTLTHYLRKPVPLSLLSMGAMGLLWLAVAVIAVFAFHAWTGLEPEPWVIVLSILMAIQAAATLVHIKRLSLADKDRPKFPQY